MCIAQWGTNSKQIQFGPMQIVNHFQNFSSLLTNLYQSLRTLWMIAKGKKTALKYFSDLFLCAKCQKLLHEDGKKNHKNTLKTTSNTVHCMQFKLNYVFACFYAIFVHFEVYCTVTSKRGSAKLETLCGERWKV